MIYSREMGLENDIEVRIFHLEDVLDEKYTFYKDNEYLITYLLLSILRVELNISAKRSTLYMDGDLDGGGI